MHTDHFYLIWPESCTLDVEISWTKPAPFDVLFSGHIEEDATAYFYSIVAFSNKAWVPYYIGITNRQTASVRNAQPDHLRRQQVLARKFPTHNFSICLGTPQFNVGTLTKATIETLEGLLIFAHWHEDIENKKKTHSFSARHQIYLRNTGFTEHLIPELAFGAMYRTA